MSVKEYNKLGGIEKIKELLQRKNQYLLNANSWAASIETLKVGEEMKVTLLMYIFTPKKK